jgi:hypothetical protein
LCRRRWNRSNNVFGNYAQRKKHRNP